MAGGLNKEFLKNPVTFLQTHKVFVIDGSMPTGLNTVGFNAMGERTMLKQVLGKPGKYQHPFECYFLHAYPDSPNPAPNFAATTAKFFFTSTLSGCQVLIHGSSLDSLSISHNNCLSNPGGYANYHGGMPPSSISAQVHNGGLYDITKDDVGNVVGVRGVNGWSFYFQKIERDQKTAARKITVTKIL